MTQPMRRNMVKILLLLAVTLPWISSPVLAQQASRAAGGGKTENVVVVTLDGFRWQELFGGLDETLLGDSKVDAAVLRESYGRNTAAESRRAIMPFFWDTIAREGQVFGDRAANCIANTANDRKFSYPGYSEMLCGIVDARIDSNDANPNPNPNVLEFLHGRPGLAGKVAAYGTWNRLNAIVNEQRSGFFVHSGWTPLPGEKLTPAQLEINAWMADLPRLWPDNVFDVVTARAAMEHLTRERPRVLYVMFGETDEWAHAGRYDCYLDAARRNDAWLAELWRTLQADPHYAGKTSLLLTTDHGRGATPKDWKNHGVEIARAEEIWIAVIGPDTPALGVRKDVSVTQSQVAATIAALLGEDFVAAHPKAAPPLPGVVATTGAK
ncbi:MAG: alkaline phosphatase family protein [Tepidisphaeraceae bacterium]